MLERTVGPDPKTSLPRKRYKSLVRNVRPGPGSRPEISCLVAERREFWRESSEINSLSKLTARLRPHGNSRGFRAIGHKRAVCVSFSATIGSGGSASHLRRRVRCRQRARRYRRMVMLAAKVPIGHERGSPPELTDQLAIAFYSRSIYLRERGRERPRAVYLPLLASQVRASGVSPRRLASFSSSFGLIAPVSLTSLRDPLLGGDTPPDPHRQRQRDLGVGSLRGPWPPLVLVEANEAVMRHGLQCARTRSTSGERALGKRTPALGATRRRSRRAGAGSSPRAPGRSSPRR